MSTNEEARQLMQRVSDAGNAVARAVAEHPTATRWDTMPWDKGYAFDIWMDVVVRDADGDVVYEGSAADFAEEWA